MTDQELNQLNYERNLIQIENLQDKAKSQDQKIEYLEFWIKDLTKQIELLKGLMEQAHLRIERVEDYNFRVKNLDKLVELQDRRIEHIEFILSHGPKG